MPSCITINLYFLSPKNDSDINKVEGQSHCPLDIIGNRLVHMFVLCTFTISCIITYQSVVHRMLAWGSYIPLPYVCYTFYKFSDPSMNEF